jgi:hypothetical protein
MFFLFEVVHSLGFSDVQAMTAVRRAAVFENVRASILHSPVLQELHRSRHHECYMLRQRRSRFGSPTPTLILISILALGIDGGRGPYRFDVAHIFFCGFVVSHRL